MKFDPMLSGDAGVRWLEQRGYVLDGGNAALRLYANEIESDRCVLRRGYVSPIRGAYETPRALFGGADRIDMFYLLKGRARVEGLDGHMSDANAGSALIRRESSPRRFECEEPIAFIQVILERNLFPMETSRTTPTVSRPIPPLRRSSPL